MSVLIVNMSSHEVELNDSTANNYDDVLYSGWVPILALPQLQYLEHKASTPESLANIDVDVFLRTMYSYQH